MQTLSLLWGMLAILGMLVAFFPCLGALNWINIPFAVIGLVIGIAAYTTGAEGKKAGSLTGLICCAIAVVFGGVRLVLGGGIL